MWGIPMTMETPCHIVMAPCTSPAHVHSPSASHPWFHRSWPPGCPEGWL